MTSAPANQTPITPSRIPGRPSVRSDRTAVCLWLLICFILVVQSPALHARNYLVRFKDGREILVETYGHEAGVLVLHRHGQRIETAPEAVEEIRKLNRPGPCEPARSMIGDDRTGEAIDHVLGHEKLTLLEPAYVSTLGRTAIEEEIQWIEDVLLQVRGDPCDQAVQSSNRVVRWTAAPTYFVI